MRFFRKQIILPILVFSFILLGTLVVAMFGKGYKFGFDKGRIEVAGTGLLVTTSTPDGAQVFINGHLTTATDNTINLFPGEYTVKIFKEGYFPWEKKIKVQKEVVSKAEALLLPTAPKLESITASGVENPTLDPSRTQIAYIVSSQTPKKNGIYTLDMTSRPVLTLQSSSRQLVENTFDDFSKSLISWSPDGQELIASTSSQQTTTYLLKAGSFNSSPSDVTATLPTVQATWEKEKMEKDEARINNLKTPLKNMIKQNFKVLGWSLDETKILYQASNSADLPIIIKPRLIGTNSTTEQRNLEKDSVYVYDIKEDKNFKILSTAPDLNLNWFPDSKHLIYVHDKKIDIMEYDGANVTTVYAGPFINGFVFPWTDASRIVILTNLGNPNIPANLYTVSLK